MLLLAAAFGVAIGLAVGTLGGGGSVLAVPLLVYVLGQGVHSAITTSLVVVTAGAVAGTIRHQRGGRVCWRHAAVFSAAAVPGIAGGTVLGNSVAGGALIAAFAVLMLLAAFGMWRRAGAERPALRGAPAPEGCPPLRGALDVTAGLLTGLATGFFGVGGGFLVVPTLAIALSFSMRLAVATSLVIVTVTSALGLVAHLLAGRGPDLSLTLAMASTCALGAFAGAGLAGKASQGGLGRGFAVLITAVAVYLLASALFLGGPPN